MVQFMKSSDRFDGMQNETMNPYSTIVQVNNPRAMENSHTYGNA